MERAYRHHRQFCDDAHCFHLALLMVYSIECGLKALLMRARNVEIYNELPNEYQVQHDFVLALTHLNAPPELQRIAKLSVKTLHGQEPQERVLPKDLHQTFRYGISIDNRADVVAGLKEILEWLKQKLP